MQGRRERLGLGLLKTPLRADPILEPLIYVTFSLATIAGVWSIAIDESRACILNSFLQHGADALVMAGELDHGGDAITNTVNATANHVANPADFSEPSVSMSGSTTGYRFLGDLPVDDKEPVPNDPNKALDPVRANAIEVTLIQVNYDTLFQALKLANVIVKYQYTGMGNADRIARPIATTTVSLQNVKHEFRFPSGLANVSEVNFPALATSTATGEDLKASWSSS
jgi:hypothetical protein